MALNDICTRLGVANACETSISILAELYGIWYNGMCLDEQDKTAKPDFDTVPNGSWTCAGSSLDKTNRVKSIYS